MTRQIILRFILPWFFLSSIFAGVAFNFISFYDPGIINNSGSWFITSIRFSDLLALTFIIFTFVSITTIKFIDKVARNPILIACVILMGFSLIYTAFSWNWQIYFINFLITGVGAAFIIPIVITLMIRVIPSDNNKIFYLIFFLLTIVMWVFGFGLTYTLIGVRFWRLLYIIVGIINIFSSILIINR